MKFYIADLKDNKEVPYEELKWPVWFNPPLFSFYQGYKSTFAGGLSADLIKHSKYSDPKHLKKMGLRGPSWYWSGNWNESRKTSHRMNRNKRMGEMHGINMKIFNHVMK